MIWLALSVWAFALLPLWWINQENRREIAGLKALYAREDARMAARTGEQIHMDGRIACISMCGFDPQ